MKSFLADFPWTKRAGYLVERASVLDDSSYLRGKEEKMLNLASAIHDSMNQREMPNGRDTVPFTHLIWRQFLHRTDDYDLA